MCLLPFFFWLNKVNINYKRNIRSRRAPPPLLQRKISPPESILYILRLTRNIKQASEEFQRLSTTRLIFLLQLFNPFFPGAALWCSFAAPPPTTPPARPRVHVATSSCPLVFNHIFLMPEISQALTCRFNSSLLK